MKIRIRLLRPPRARRTSVPWSLRLRVKCWPWLLEAGRAAFGRGAGDYLVTYVGAPVIDEPRGAIQLVESLAPRAAYVSRGVWSGHRIEPGRPRRVRVDRRVDRRAHGGKAGGRAHRRDAAHRRGAFRGARDLGA